MIKRSSWYEFSLWDRDFVSVVRVIEGPYYIPLVNSFCTYFSCRTNFAGLPLFFGFCHFEVGALMINQCWPL